MDKYTEIGERLKILREEYELSQSKLGAFLKVSRHLISDWEDGRKRMNLQTLIDVCEFFDCSADFLLFGRSRND